MTGDDRVSGSAEKMELEDFHLKEQISKGSFGTVLRAVRKADQQVFAIKQVNLKGMSRVLRQEAVDEAVLAGVDGDGKLNIVMEYASNGTIHHLVRAKRKLPEDLALKYFLQALMGLEHIHSKKIIHRDIKTLNLFLDSKNDVKIGDLGIARALSDNSDVARTLVGTPFYLSPELCNDKPYDERTDIWALGVCLYEMVSGRRPFDAQNEGALIRKIMRGQFAPLQGVSSATTELIRLCLTFDPRKRPDARALINMAVAQERARQLGIDLTGRAYSAQLLQGEPVYERRAAPQPAGPQVAAAAAMPSMEPAHASPAAAGQQPGAGYGRQPTAAHQLPPDHPFYVPLAQQPPAGHAGPGPLQPPQRPPQLPPAAPPGQHPFALPGSQHAQQALENLRLDANMRRVSAEAQDMMQVNAHAGRRDSVGDVFSAQPATAGEKVANRVRPEALPPAGALARPMSSPHDGRRSNGSAR